MLQMLHTEMLWTLVLHFKRSNFRSQALDVDLSLMASDQIIKILNHLARLVLLYLFDFVVVSQICRRYKETGS